MKHRAVVALVVGGFMAVAWLALLSAAAIAVPMTARATAPMVGRVLSKGVGAPVLARLPGVPERPWFEPPGPPPDRAVHCPWDREIGAVPERFWERTPDGFVERPLGWEGDGVEFRVSGDLGGRVHAGPAGVFPVRWGGGNCAIGFPTPAVVAGRVDGFEDGERVVVNACKHEVAVGADGTWRLETRRSRCRVAVVRYDGLLVMTSPPVVVELHPGRTKEVDLEVPDVGAGGLGIEFEPGDDGVGVQRVVEGSPAQAAGLQAGDVIVRIDGVDTPGLDAGGFQEIGRGEPGTVADLLVERGHDLVTVTVVRDYVR